MVEIPTQVGRFPSSPEKTIRTRAHTVRRSDSPLHAYRHRMSARSPAAQPIWRESSLSPEPTEQIGSPAQLNKPARTPFLYSCLATRSSRITAECLKMEERRENEH